MEYKRIYHRFGFEMLETSQGMLLVHRETHLLQYFVVIFGGLSLLSFLSLLILLQEGISVISGLSFILTAIFLSGFFIFRLRFVALRRLPLDEVDRRISIDTRMGRLVMHDGRARALHAKIEDVSLSSQLNYVFSIRRVMIDLILRIGDEEFIAVRTSGGEDFHTLKKRILQQGFIDADDLCRTSGANEKQA
jgi:hypothetical protein